MGAVLAKLFRRYVRSRVARITPAELHRVSHRKLLRCFHRAANQSAAYRILLAEAGVSPREIGSADDVLRHCPILQKSNTFHRFGLQDLIARDVRASDIASILTSSGHGGGGFALGLGTRAQANGSRELVDIGLELAFDVDRRRTLLINCLPMGVSFQSNAICVANVSVREDMACAIVDQSGDLFDQIILCGDPLFLKRLCDYSETQGTNWGRHRLNAIIGEETFPETFRDYLAATLGVNLDSPDDGVIGSSMGVAELGLNLFYETRETIALRRACMRDAGLLERLLGRADSSGVLPTFLVYNPLRSFVEVATPDQYGDGDLIVTVLDRSAPIPLVRYKTGDRAQLVDPAKASATLIVGKPAVKSSAFPVIALYGRAKDRLSSGWHVDTFKDMLYKQRNIARQMTGAFRLSQHQDAFHCDVQLARDSKENPAEMALALQAELPSPSMRERPTVICHAYDQFPYGLSLDYERKFLYWQGGEINRRDIPSGRLDS